jgi:hypothetical protein
LENETKNSLEKCAWIDSESFQMRDVVIVSDGYGFQNKQKILSKLPKSTTIIGVNGSLIKWNLTDRVMNWYVVNNPYRECMKYLPRRNRIMPKCIASCRTNHQFMSAYKGIKYKYYPVNEKKYSGFGLKETQWQVDDYRNSICAALNIAYRFGAENIMLFCCDDSFLEERDNAIQLPNKLWTYKPLLRSHEIIDANLYWLTQEEEYQVQVADCSSGLNYSNAAYINSEEEVVSFFTDL